MLKASVLSFLTTTLLLKVLKERGNGSYSPFPRSCFAIYNQPTNLSSQNLLSLYPKKANQNEAEQQKIEE